MRIYMFVSQRDLKIVAFTSDETGENLPLDRGPWRPSNNGLAVAAGDGTGPLTDFLKKFGYYVTTEPSIH